MKTEPVIYLCFQPPGSQRTWIQSEIYILCPDLPFGYFSSRQSRILARVRLSLIQGQNPLCFQPEAAPAKQKAWALSAPTSGKETVYQNGRHMPSSWLHPLPRGREGLILFTERHQNRPSSGEWVSWAKGKSGCYCCFLQVLRSVATGFVLLSSVFFLLVDQHHASFLRRSHLSFSKRSFTAQLYFSLLFGHFFLQWIFVMYISQCRYCHSEISPGHKDNLGKEERSELLKYVA